jgi:hypothetical protein
MGGICGTISVFYFSGIRMRILSIITDIFWLSYNIINFSIGGMMAGIFMIIAHMLSIYRIKKYS